MTTFDYAHSTALVTGASRGIGAEIARQLAQRGIAILILAARSENDLTELANEIRGRYGTQVEVIPADLSNEDAAENLQMQIRERGLFVDLLVNNAGFGSHGVFHELDLAREERMIAVNIASLLRLTRLFLPEMHERGRGGIIQVASTAAFQPVPYMTTYAATKAFVLSFSEGLYVESQEKGGDVRIVCLCPGGTRTDFDFGQGEGAERGRFEKMPMDTAESVARVALDGLDANAMTVISGTFNHLVPLGARLLPREVTARVSAGLFRPVNLTPAQRSSLPAWKKAAVLTTGAAVIAAIAVGWRNLKANS